MDSHNNDQNNGNSGNNHSGLSSSEYRAKLLTKLNCLIAVLEVAVAKISRSINLPGANEERLNKIRSNLENTLSICKRAKGTLESGMATNPKQLLSKKREVAQSGEKMSYRDYVELSSIDEYQKFKTLPPIKENELSELDMDALLRQLYDS